MRIVMFTNTYKPHVGGVARSVEAFTTEFRRRGHRVLVVAPEFEHMPAEEVDVIRIPAMQNFNGSDFSVVLATPAELRERLEDFGPQVVHSHHPFLLGNEAVRMAHTYDLPLVFTHHTLYEQYTHYVPADSELLQRFVIELASCYANMCQQVFAPSESIAELLRERDVEVPIEVVPTGVNYPFFTGADGAGFRAEHGIGADRFVVGHVGRLAPEKNLGFLSEAVIGFLRDNPQALFLLAGKGPSSKEIVADFEEAGLQDNLALLGELEHEALRHVYAAMDVFVFSSKSETQGMVLTEAMATGTPVVALDASGVREVVTDRVNGRLLPRQVRDEFVAALQWVADMDRDRYRQLREAADRTGQAYSLQRCADLALECYESLLQDGGSPPAEMDAWQRTSKQIAVEWEIFSGEARALRLAMQEQLTGGQEESAGSS